MSALAWCPQNLARVVNHGPCKHAPREARFDGQVWLAFCMNTCTGHGQAESIGQLFRCRFRHTHGRLNAVAPESIAAMCAAITAVRPLVSIDAAVLIPSASRAIAFDLGADRWGVSFVGKTPALVGLDRLTPIAFVALTDPAFKCYGADLRAMVAS